MTILPTVHMFWHGSPLSRIEILSLASFVYHGHPVELHSYSVPLNVPAAVTIRDARQTLPEREVFRDANGSLATFADRFRYELLARNDGALWSDLDVICLQPVTVPANGLFFAFEDPSATDAITNNVLALPSQHPLLRALLKRARRPYLPRVGNGARMNLRRIRRTLAGKVKLSDVEWCEIGPLALSLEAKRHGVNHLAQPSSTFCAVPWPDWRLFFDPDPLDEITALLQRSLGAHLWNEITRHEPGFDKNATHDPTSPFERWWHQYVGAS